MTAKIIISIGLIFDIFGAIFVANEVIRVFRGARTVDTGGSGAVNGAFVGVENKKFTEYEKKKRKLMWIGLALLILGFILQGVGAWWPIIEPWISHLLP